MVDQRHLEQGVLLGCTIREETGMHSLMLRREAALQVCMGCHLPIMGTKSRPGAVGRQQGTAGTVTLLEKRKSLGAK